jgi:hypothetical protein
MAGRSRPSRRYAVPWVGDALDEHMALSRQHKTRPNPDLVVERWQIAPIEMPVFAWIVYLRGRDLELAERVAALAINGMRLELHHRETRNREPVNRALNSAAAT